MEKFHKGRFRNRLEGRTMKDRDLEKMVEAATRGDDQVRRPLWIHLDAVAIAARTGNGKVRNALWWAVRPYLIRIALRLRVPPDDVPDLVQEVLFVADRKLATFDPRKAGFKTWLIRILLNRRNNLFRGRVRFLECLRKLFREAEPRGNGNGHLEIDKVEARMALESLLSSLTRRQKSVVALFEIAGLTSKETGTILGMSAAGVRSINRVARKRLYGKIHPRHDSP